MKQEQKLRSKDISNRDMAAFLRKLADRLENPSLHSDALPELEGLTRCELKIKAVEQGFDLKLCITRKLQESPSPAMQHTHPKYSEVKKRMKKSFTRIMKAVRTSVFPPEETVRSFMDDSRLMVTYPGYGEEYYDKYLKSCAEFKAAWDDRDPIRFQKAVEELNRQKSRCHGSYK